MTIITLSHSITRQEFIDKQFYLGDFIVKFILSLL